MRWLRIVLVSLVFILPRQAAAAPWGSGDPQGGLWLSLTGFLSFSAVGNGAGVLVMMGVPLDALATRTQVHQALADPPVLPPPSPPPERTTSLVLSPALARDAVQAAWRTAHVADDGRFTSLATRARLSALLPEVRLRAMRNTRDAAAPSDLTRSTYSPYFADRTVLEARAVFHLDRLVFADEEVPIERLRADAVIERERIAHRVVEELGKWQRARLDVVLTPLDSADHLDAALRVIEAESSLDVLTGGWFSQFLAERSKEDAP